MSDLKQRCTTFLDLAKGGWMQIYEIYDGRRVVGSKCVSTATWNSPIETAYATSRHPDRVFKTVTEFLVAYRAECEEKSDGAAA